nr:MAG TPA: hypothetical protein [Caudoviricetes sp.]
MYDRILTRNNKFFRDIVEGEYGRRVLYTDVEEINVRQNPNEKQ